MTNIKVIKEIYRTFQEKDYDAFKEICSPDLEWIQNPGFPNGSTDYGAEVVIENVFKSFNNNWESWKFEIEEYLDTANSVIVIGFYEGVGKRTRKSFRSNAAHVYDFVDGKVIKFRQFADTLVIWDSIASLPHSIIES
ncbi:MAG: nuclear transport factor 2 family protein [Cyanobacteria bacterium P01_H01_bin.150]